MCSIAYAQVPARKDFELKQEDPYYFHKCNSFFTRIPLQVNAGYAESVINYLQENIANLQSSKVGLTLLKDIESPGGRHLTFEQTFSGMPVFQSQVKVNLDKNNNVKSVFDNSWTTTTWAAQAVESDFESLDLNIIKSRFGNQRSLDRNPIKIRKVIAVLNDAPVALAEIELWDYKTDEHFLLLVDNSMNIFLKRDLNSYRSDNASALVFIPDPLTSAHEYYGTPYVDDSNRDVSVLNSQRKPVIINVTFDGGIYKLQNQYAVIWDFSTPNIPPTESSTTDFSFTRAQTEFEDVNAFYHISVFSQYIESLGLGGLVSEPVYVDAHALDGKDQSMFSPGFNGLQLFFGDGGVNDAEDADVIVHEFGHALSYSASPNTNSGSERNAVDEGLCDYLATSYSRAIDTFRWKDMFTWDGHNEYWNGRTAATNKVYPRDLVSSIHANGEIYSAALMNIQLRIGMERTDRILLQSLYGLATDMSMKDAAMLLYDADSALYGGENFCVIYEELLKKGLTDTGTALLFYDPVIPINAGNDQVICKGDSATLGDLSAYRCDYIYRWAPAEGLSSPNAVATKAAPGATKIYTLYTSKINGAWNYDSVKVTFINSCFLNTDGFKWGEDVIVKLPANTDNNIIELFDINGKRLFKQTDIPGADYPFSGDLLAPGVYILRVTSDRGKEIQKLVKLSRQ
jgi:hypothetical protein